MDRVDVHGAKITDQHVLDEPTLIALILRAQLLYLPSYNDQSIESIRRAQMILQQQCIVEEQIAR